MKFGMPRTLKRAAKAGCRSVSTLRTMACPAISAAARATSGAAMRHGPHQAAQKSTNTGTCAFRTISVKSASSTFKGSSNAASGFLQAPQRPVSERCPAGIRFFCPHTLQLRITGTTQYFLSARHRRFSSFAAARFKPARASDLSYAAFPFTCMPAHFSRSVSVAA